MTLTWTARNITFVRALAIFSLINNDAVSCDVGVDANRLLIVVITKYYEIFLPEAETAY